MIQRHLVAKKKRFNYIRKKLAPGTWFDVLTAIVAFLMLMSCIVTATVMKGQGPMTLGAIGLSSIVVAIYTLFNVFSVERQPDYNYLPANMAAVTSGAVILLWIFLLLVGLFQ